MAKKQSVGKTKHTEQTIENFGFDETFMFPKKVAWGYDSTNEVLRRLAVDGDGKLKVSLS